MKRANLILLIDSSSSIKEKKIGAMEDAVLNIVQMFQALCSSNDQVEGYIGAMTFGSAASLHPLQNAEGYIYPGTVSKGETQMGAMLQRLSRELLVPCEELSSTGDYKNILVLLSDGGATDILSEGYVEALRNPSFVNSRRIAVSVGDRVNTRMLSSFCTLSCDLFKAEDIEPINDVLRSTIETLVSPKPTLRFVRKRQFGEDWE